MNQLPSNPSLEVPIKVYFYDTDAGGVVHNIAYLRFVETARSQLAEYMGWALIDMLGESCPVVARTEIDYIKPAKLGDKLMIKGKLVCMEKVRFYLAFEIVRVVDSALIAKALQTMVTVDLKTGRPRPLRKDWLLQWSNLVKEK
ncbi:MAG: acyl-CoA thioesterase [Verrucomicrobiota bacterium]